MCWYFKYRNNIYKWAEWIENLSFIIPSNIEKGVIATHICDNINWKNKNVNESENHHTNSTLVQKYDLIENVSKISLDADYNFERKSHRSYKGSIQELPDFYLKRGSARPLKYTPVNEKEESPRSSFNFLVWVHSRNMKEKENQSIPSWSGFKELVSDPDLDKVNVGYLPPIPFPSTSLKVIAAGSARPLKYTPVNEKEESPRSSFNFLVWVHSRNMKEKENQSIPSWSEFKELVSDPDLDKVNVGYLPPTPFPPTSLKVIAAVVRQTENIMEELTTNFIFIEADQAIYRKKLDLISQV